MQTYHIHRSDLLFIFLIVIYGGAIVCVVLLPWAFSWKCLLCFFCGGGFYYQYWHYILFRAGNSYIGLSYVGEKKWHLYNNQQDCITVLLQKSSVVWKYCIVLHFRDEITRRFCSLVIFCDAMSLQQFHKLKVCVRTAK
jgi:hypothetical protein